MSAPSHARRLAILGYHKIGEPPAGSWPTWYYVPEATFVAQLARLAEHGWTVVDIGRVLAGLAEPDRLPEKAALLTFDDGYRSIRDVVVPRLLRFGYPAVLFVPAGYIGGHNSFDADREPEEPICDWDDLRAVARQGISIQSHGVWHRGLSELEPAAQVEDVVRSKAVLEEGLGQPVEVFSYPYGDPGPDPEATRRVLSGAGYRAACLYGGGPVTLPGADPYRLDRLAMGPDTDLDTELGREGT